MNHKECNTATASPVAVKRQHRVLKLRRSAVAQHVDLLLDAASEEGDE